VPDINEIIQNRRSHFPKEFTGEVLPDSIIEQCLENANWAPSHKLTFPWRFVVLKGESVSSFYDLAKTDYLENTDSINPLKLDKIEMMSAKTSHMIGIICVKSDLVPEWEELASCAMAVQNMYLSLSQFKNAGGYWSTGLRADKEAMREFYDCKDNEIHMGNFIMGYVEVKREVAGRELIGKYVTWEKIE